MSDSEDLSLDNLESKVRGIITNDVNRVKDTLRRKRQKLDEDQNSFKETSAMFEA